MKLARSALTGCLAVVLSNAAAGEAFIGAPEPGRAPTPSPLSPADQLAAFTLAPGFEIELVASESEGIGKFVTIDWDLHGRMWSMTALEYPVDANENEAAAKELYSRKAQDKVLVWDQPYGPGPITPRIFAEGLAIPLGLLPYRNGVFVQHGPDIVFLSDTDGNGRADRRDVTLSGFGIQDSHLFPHQFTRAPGNWIWMAQGAFNYGKVRTTRGSEHPFDRTRMARFRLDGSEFEITSQGPCNIWGLVLTAEGEAWIQEANDYGYPAMPFHLYANYPGCSDAEWKSYAPEFPATAPSFQMGGTGLSGLALSDRAAWPAPYAQVMYVANPITRKIQAIRIHREGPRYRLEKLPDFIQSADEMFRPVAIRFGPDGCLYIVDWYNKIISHNEVPRNHPERDKKRGRIWRVKHRAQVPFHVSDFTRLPSEALLAKLGGESLTQHHLAWQAIVDRRLIQLSPSLKQIIGNRELSAGKRIGALWALEGLGDLDAATVKPLLTDPSRNVRREAVRVFGSAFFPASAALEALEPLADDVDPEVRAEVIRTTALHLDRGLSGNKPVSERALKLLFRMARPSLPEPTTRSTHSGRMIRIGEAYDREFERYLVRQSLERYPQVVARFLETRVAEALPLESRMVAVLALGGKTGAVRLAQLADSMEREFYGEEVALLCKFNTEPDVNRVLKAVLNRPETQLVVLEALSRMREPVDPTLAGEIAAAVRTLLARSPDDRAMDLLLSLATIHRIRALESEVVAVATREAQTPERLLAALRALREIGASRPDLFQQWALNDRSGEVLRREAVLALVCAGSDGAVRRLAEIWPVLPPRLRRAAVDQVAVSDARTEAFVRAIKEGQVNGRELDAYMLEKLRAAAPADPELEALQSALDANRRPVLRLEGNNEDHATTAIDLVGAFTVETWIRLDPGIGNEDGILGGQPGNADFNFAGGLFRVYAGRESGDVIIAKKPMEAEAWTHIAVTRDDPGIFRIYINGEPAGDAGRTSTASFMGLHIGRTRPGAGTAGMLAEYRIWNVARSAEEIHAAYRVSLRGEPRPDELVHYFAGEDWGPLSGRARVTTAADFPSLATLEEMRVESARFEKFREYASRQGDSARGREVFNIACRVCHSVGGEGGRIGPTLNGAGAMGIEALLRSILTPNAAVESGYYAYRVETSDDELQEGLLVSQTEAVIVLRSLSGQEVEIPRARVRRGFFTRTSLMPEGLLDGMAPADAVDLLSYLQALK